MSTRELNRAADSLETPVDPLFRILVVVGPSGSGRSTVAAALEDHGFSVVDNPPLSILESVVDAARAEMRVPQNRGLALTLASPAPRAEIAPETHPISSALANLRLRPEFKVTLIYLDAEDSVLLRRYKETRRRHPQSEEADLAQAVAEERARLALLRTQADLTLDTSDLTPHALRAEIAERFGPPDQKRMTLSVQSFGFKNGAPRDADLMFDARFLNNPYWKPELRILSGREEAVAAYIAADPNAAAFIARLTEMLKFLLPLYEKEGKSYLTVAIGCTGGQHRSVYVAEAMARNLREAGWSPKLRHRDMRPPQTNEG